jgi:hypothetical protein
VQEIRRFQFLGIVESIAFVDATLDSKSGLWLLCCIRDDNYMHFMSLEDDKVVSFALFADVRL